MKHDTFLIGRQPILDKNKQIAGYELLFRKPEAETAEVDEGIAATARVLVNIFQNIGSESLLGDKPGFVNIDEHVIMQDFLEVLPKENLVFEIVESTRVTPQLVEKISYYRKQGYRFALDDLVFTEEYFTMFQHIMRLVEVVKVDFMLANRASIARFLPMLRDMNVKLLAEKVETEADVAFASQLGFDLFQGYYFARPNIITRQSIEPSKLAVMKLLNLLGSDASVEALEREFKLQPEFSIKLLKLINSSSFFLRSEISSIRHALNLLGRTNIQKWLVLLLYAGADTASRRNPLLELALLRARSMELLAEKAFGAKNPLVGQAYFTGLLSLMHAVFCISVDDLVESLNIGGMIKPALTLRQGNLGVLLQLIEATDNTAMSLQSVHLDQLGLSMQDVADAKIASFEWVAEQQATMLFD